MKPVFQTSFGSKKGNCQAACVASILEIPIEDVPCHAGDAWFLKWETWLGGRGLSVVSFNFDGGVGLDFVKYFFGEGFYIVAGLSPRARKDGHPADMFHAVVYQGGKLVHDPHPAGGGVLDIREVDIIVPCPTMTERISNRREGRICTCGAIPEPTVDPTCPRHGTER